MPVTFLARAGTMGLVVLWKTPSTIRSMGTYHHLKIGVQSFRPSIFNSVWSYKNVYLPLYLTLHELKFYYWYIVNGFVAKPRSSLSYIAKECSSAQQHVSYSVRGVST